MKKKWLLSERTHSQPVCDGDTGDRLELSPAGTHHTATLATQANHNSFYTEILNLRDYCTPYILKADGGTLSFELSAAKPVETIFSGLRPAHWVCWFDTRRGNIYVVISVEPPFIWLILSELPLFASCSARVGDRLTHVRSFATSSAAVEDSYLEVEDGALKIMPYRKLPCLLFRGPAPHPLMLRVAGLTEWVMNKSHQAMEILGRGLS